MDLSEYAMKYIGTNYSWGGKSVEQGFDCSGLVSECLKAFGYIPNDSLANSQMLFDLLKKGDRFGSGIKKNSILFFGRDVDSITHISIALDKKFMVESGGEGKIETDSGFVRVRPIRKDLVGSVILPPAEDYNEEYIHVPFI